MAQKVVTTWVSDLSGVAIEQADPTVRFGLDGAAYEIDLTAEEAQAFRDAIAEYVGSAKRVSAGGPRRPVATGTGARSDASTIRAWAKENGHEVPERGRIPSAVREAYESAR